MYNLLKHGVLDQKKNFLGHLRWGQKKFLFIKDGAIRFITFGFLYSTNYLIVTTGFHTVKALRSNQLIVTTYVGASKQ